MEEKARNAVGSVDGALTSALTFALYGCSLHVGSAAAFGRLTWASALSVLLAAGLFAGYLSLWHDHPHRHAALGGTKLDGAHAHTTQQLRSLGDDGAHAHVHFAAAQICGGEVDPHSHGHDHDHGHGHFSA